MTPMIDVVFNLLIFFLVATTYLDDERRVDIELPRAPSAAPLTDAPDELPIAIDRAGSVYLRGDRVTLDELKARLAKAVENYPDQAVSVRGDGDTRYETVAQVIAIAREAGVSHLDVLVEEP